MKTTEQFIQESKALHPNKYTYTKTVYVGCMQKVVLTCPVHGDFQVTPNSHLSTQRSGCQKCAKRHHYSQQEFIEEAIKIHKNKYDYSNVTYINNKIKIEIICPEHGSFFQLPVVHTRNGGGCKKCAAGQAGSYHKKNTAWFIETAVSIHGTKYNYASTTYKRYHDKVEIICPEHGSFFQTAGSHLHNRSGCPMCSYRDYEGGYGIKRFANHPEIKNNPAVLYVVRVHNDQETFVKVGITQKTIDERLTGRLPYSYDVIGTVSGRLYNLFLVEQAVKKQLKLQKYRPSIKFNGHTECFNVETLSELCQLVGINTYE